MSCCSCCGGRGCSSCNYVVVLPSEAPETLNFSNINLNGVGVLASAVQPNIYFRGVSSANALLTVTLDAGNNAILLTVDSAAIAAALPQATTTQAGVGETATDAEAIAKASTTVFVTPSNFAAMDASTTFKGFIEIATNAEAQAGASALLAITPASLASVTALQKTTTTFADSVARAALVPTFKGQFGYQLDSLMPYSAYGTSAGNWLPMLTFGITNTIPAVSTTITMGVGATVTVNGGGWTYTGVQVGWNGASALTLNGGTFTIDTLANVSVDNATIALTSGAVLDINNSVLNFDTPDVQISGTSIPASSVVTTAGVGVLSSEPVSSFLSAHNVDTGWTVTNLTPLRALDCSASTLGDLRNIVGTLLSIILDSTPLKPSA